MRSPGGGARAGARGFTAGAEEPAVGKASAQPGAGGHRGPCLAAASATDRG